jgi:hypothetical protein
MERTLSRKSRQQIAQTSARIDAARKEGEINADVYINIWMKGIHDAMAEMAEKGQGKQH